MAGGGAMNVAAKDRDDPLAPLQGIA